MAIRLWTRTIRGKVFGAAHCLLLTDDGPIPSVAVKAGEEHWVTSRDGAIEWLANRGLTPRQAEAFLTGALRRHSSNRLSLLNEHGRPVP